MDVMRSRAVLLPALGDPFLLKLWFRNFENIWQGEIDKVYLSLSYTDNSKLEKVNNFIENFVSKNKKVIVIRNNTNSLVEQFKIPFLECKEVFFVYIQEDAFVFKKGVLDRYFKIIESGEFNILGSRQAMITPSYQFLWLNFLFMKWQDVADTEMNFDLGNYEGVSYDIMGKVQLQMQDKGKTIDFIEQRTNEMYHVNGLSSIFNYLYREDVGEISDFSDLGTKIEMLRRIGWWKSCYDVFKDECKDIVDFCNEYEDKINYLMDKTLL